MTKSPKFQASRAKESQAAARKAFLPHLTSKPRARWTKGVIQHKANPYVYKLKSISQEDPGKDCSVFSNPTIKLLKGTEILVSVCVL